MLQVQDQLVVMFRSCDHMLGSRLPAEMLWDEGKGGSSGFQGKDCSLLRYPYLMFFDGIYHVRAWACLVSEA